VDGPRELYDAIVAETKCDTAIIDGVLVADWKDESDLEVDDHGNAYTRQFGGRQIFAAFDLLEIDGESLDVHAGDAVMYFPEANVLVPHDHVAAGSNTPASKAIVVTVAPCSDGETARNAMKSALRTE